MKINLIPTVFDLATGQYIEASDYFSNLTDIRRDEIHSKRRELILAKRQGKKLWVCAMCQAPVSIAGGHGENKRRHHFKHFVSDERCPYQTKGLPKDVIQKIKYNGAKESTLHWEMKNTLAALLEEDLLVSGQVDVEKTFFHEDKGQKWRRPDVACTRYSLQLVFEVQISTDFVDVIVGREEFYRSQGVFILWVFRHFNSNQYTVRDIYVGNQKNVFVFNKRVQEISQAKNQLTFECHYKFPFLEGLDIKERWQIEDVTLNDLTFDQDKMQAYFFHYDEAYAHLEKDKLREEFTHYWNDVRESLNTEERLDYDEKFEDEFSKVLGIPKRNLHSPAVKMIDALYSLREGRSLKTNQNLFGVVDVLLEHRKQFMFVTLWAIEIFGYHGEFKGRPNFEKKVAAYKAGKNSNPDYKRDTRYDSLFAYLFPELNEKLPDLGRN